MKIKKSIGAILVKQNNDLVVDYFNLPKKLHRGQVLVKIKLAGVCGSQIGEIKGVKGKDSFLPHLLGHEGVGIVVEKHTSVKKLKVDDKVLLHWMPSKGINAENPKYTWRNRQLNSGKITTFSEYSIISENRLTKIGKKISNYNAVLLGCTASTAIGSVKKIAKVKKNSCVVVAGCGLIGQFIVKLLSQENIKKIIVIDNNIKKIRSAMKKGAHDFFLIKNGSYKKINSLKNTVDYFFECSGNIDILNIGFKILKFNGTEILIGVTKKGKLAKFNPLEINLGKKIKGSKGGEFNPDQDILKFNKILQNNKISYKNFIQGTYKLNKINMVIKNMISGKISGKPIIKFS
jgi:Zn-dependent alcohol dehydrogenase